MNYIVSHKCSILELISTFPGAWNEATNLVNAFYPVPVNKDCQKKFAFSWQGKEYTFTFDRITTLHPVS